MTSNNPLRRDFWLGSVDSRPFALFRIGLGLAILHDLFDYTRDFRAFLTDDGMLPRSVQREWTAWSVFDLAGSTAGVGVLFAIGVVAVACYTLGYRTRIATVVAWFWMVSLHNRNYYVTDGGDTFAGIMLFWSCFADLGATWSLDARRRGARAMIPAMPVRLLQAHLAFLYLATARLKLRPAWFRGDAVYHSLQLDGFVRPIGAWVGRSPTLSRFATWGILAMEGSFPFLAFSPVLIGPARAMAVFCGVAIQLGIAITMRVGIFQEAMLASCALFILPEWLDALAGWWQRRTGTGVRRATPVDHPANDTVRTAPLWAAVLALQFALCAWPFIGERRFPVPEFVRRERDFLSIVQPSDLFGATWAIRRWRAPGVLASGRTSDVLAVTAPGTEPRGAGWQFSRWNKFTYKEGERGLPWQTLAPYLCRAFAERVPGDTLREFSVIDDGGPPRHAGEPPPPPQQRVLWTQRCP